MGDGCLVARLERLSNLLRNGDGVLDRDRPLLDPLSECRSLDELENERARLEPEDARDVRTVQRREELGLPLEPTRRSSSPANSQEGL